MRGVKPLFLVVVLLLAEVSAKHDKEKKHKHEGSSQRKLEEGIQAGVGGKNDTENGHDKENGHGNGNNKENGHGNGHDKENGHGNGNDKENGRKYKGKSRNEVEKGIQDNAEIGVFEEDGTGAKLVQAASRNAKSRKQMVPYFVGHLSPADFRTNALEGEGKALIEEGNEKPEGQNSTGHGQFKRQALGGSVRWSKCIVPYSFVEVDASLQESASGQAAIRRAMEYIEKNTCITFKQWYQNSDGTTLNQKEDLGHRSFLKFIKSGRCYATIGCEIYAKEGEGQIISACSSYSVAVHELLHSLGFIHEHERPDRESYIIRFPENAIPDYKSVFTAAPNDNTHIYHPYDYASIMQYGPNVFSRNGEPTITTVSPDDKFLLGNSEETASFYDFMGVNNFYDCSAISGDCSSPPACENDGYVGADCTCVCPSLFSGPTCEETYKPSGQAASWPVGSYGIPQPVSGCPDDENWTTGSRGHAMETGTKLGRDGLLKPVSSNYATDYFCIRASSSSSTSAAWPPGTYCINKYGDTCPEGFQSGSIFYDDDNERGKDENSESGTLPAGEYTQNTVYEYCCRDDGPASVAIATLPTNTAFVLLRYGTSCQAVLNMMTTAVYIHYALEAIDTVHQSSGMMPFYELGSTESNMYVYYCHYTPIKYGSGGTIKLDASHPLTNIHSPSYPEYYENGLKWSWFVKAPEGSTIIVDFVEFDVEADDKGNCKDTVEVRRNLIGQPGQRFCGKNFDTSLISHTGFILLVLRTDTVNTRRGFNATIRIVTKDESCYHADDLGSSYRGHVSVSEHNWPCLPWHEVKHCDVNPFDKRYLFAGLMGNNYCRNPNKIARPWCYVSKGCYTDFCDVCDLGRCYDNFDDCEDCKRLDSAYCKKDQSATYSCQKSCDYCGIGSETLATSCAPPTVQDKNSLVIDDSRSTYKFGDTVTVKCENVQNAAAISRTWTCTTDGNFSGEDLFCGTADPSQADNYYCQDTVDNCADILNNNTGMCEMTDFASVFCRQTCGICGQLSTCSVPSAVANGDMVVDETNGQIQVGRMVTYTCHTGYSLASGDETRVCTAKGTLTGSPPVCKSRDLLVTTHGMPLVLGEYLATPKKILIYDAKDATVDRYGEVVQWDIYSGYKGFVVAQVWRKLSGGDEPRYTLVGQTRVNLRANRVNTYVLKPYERYAVQKGDVIGWYTPVTHPGLVFTHCTTQNNTVHEADMTDMNIVQVGLELVVPFKDYCRNYSIALTVGPRDPASYSPAINVAAMDKGGRCTAATSDRNMCNQVIDGNFKPMDGAWCSENEGEGASLTLEFDEVFTIHGLGIMQNTYAGGQIDSITLTFEDGSTHECNLCKRDGVDILDFDATLWDTIPLTKEVKSKSVKITVDSVYSTHDNGFIEIEVYGSCTDGWRMYNGISYKVIEDALSNSEAKQKCDEFPNSQLARIPSEDALNFIFNLASTQEIRSLWVDDEQENSASHCRTLDLKDGKISTRSCDLQHSYVCEKSLEREPLYKTSGEEIIPRRLTNGDGSIGIIFIPKTESMTVQEDGSIIAWKLFMNAISLFNMVVLRPDPVLDNSFTLIGVNAIEPRSKRTTIYDVPEFARINVNKGDIVGFQYLAGYSPALMYDTCTPNPDEKILKYTIPLDRPLEVEGEPFPTVVEGWRPCRRYSVGFLLTKDHVSVMNVAKETFGATCSEASVSPHTCCLALDDSVLNSWDHAWVVDSTGQDQWMTIKLNKEYSFVGGRVAQIFRDLAQIEQLDIIYGGHTQTVTLKQRFDTNFRGHFWDIFELDKTVSSDTIKCQISSTYVEGKVGILEIEFYTHGCSARFKRHKSYCYEFSGNTTRDYFSAEEYCMTQEGHIAVYESSELEEEDFLLQLAGGSDVYLGIYTMEGTTWKAEIGSVPDLSKVELSRLDGITGYDICIQLSASKAWNKVRCRTESAWICKKPLESPTGVEFARLGSTSEPRSKTDGSSDYFFIEEGTEKYIPRSGTIKGWRMYTDVAQDIAMLVLRPVSDTNFKLQGINLITTPAGKVDIITVPEFERINVEKGDYIGWYYLPGFSPNLQYDALYSNGYLPRIMKGRRYKGKEESIWETGTILKTSLNTFYQYRRYSVGFILDYEPAAELWNAAYSSTCIASTGTDTSWFIRDGGYLPYSMAWISKQNIGAWIKIDLDGDYTIQGLGIQQRYYSQDRAKVIKLDFYGGISQEVTLADRVGTSPDDYRAQVMDTIALDDIATSYIKLSVTNMPTTGEFGIVEMKVFTHGCDGGWRFSRGSCFKMNYERLTWDGAEAQCVTWGSHLSSARDEDEMEFLFELTRYTGWVFLGYYRTEQGTYESVDGIADAFIRWNPGRPWTDPDKKCVAMREPPFLKNQGCDVYPKRSICRKAPRKAPAFTPATRVGTEAKPRRKADGHRRLSIANREENYFKEDGTVVGWVVYAVKNSTMVMLVWEQTTDNEFTLIGANTIQTQAYRATYTQVPPHAQIHAKAGQLIGIQQIEGGGGLHWQPCPSGESVTMTFHERKSGYSFPMIGDKVEIGTSSFYSCRLYAMEAVVEPVREPLALNNLALHRSTKCTASANSALCDAVMDDDVNSEWFAPVGAEKGAWVEMEFDKEYSIKYISIIQRYGYQGQTKVVKLSFGDTIPSQTVTLAQRTSGSFTDKRNGFLDDFEIKEIVTSSIRFTIEEVYTASTNGFVEIRVFTDSITPTF